METYSIRLMEPDSANSVYAIGVVMPNRKE